jgi:hypothetical protein
MAVPFGPDEKARYVELIRRGRMPRMASEDVGFTWATIKTHLKNDPEFAEAVTEAKRRALEPIEEVTYDLALEGKEWAVKEILHNKLPDEWSDRRVTQTQLTGPGGGPIQIAAVSTDAWRLALTNPELRADALSFGRELPAAIETTGAEA